MGRKHIDALEYLESITFSAYSNTQTHSYSTHAHIRLKRLENHFICFYSGIIWQLLMDFVMNILQVTVTLQSSKLSTMSQHIKGPINELSMCKFYMFFDVTSRSYSLIYPGIEHGIKRIQIPVGLRFTVSFKTH